MAQSRTVLITGAAQRLGRAYALSLSKAGWDVAIHYNSSAAPARALAALIAKQGRKAYLVKADLSNAEAVATIIPSLVKQRVSLDCLINNAAVFEKDTLATLTPKRWEAHTQVNLLAPLMLMRDFAAHYKGTTGNIINITDGLHGWSMSGEFLSYALSKHSLSHATEMLARQLAPHIRLNAIAPGATLKGPRDKKSTFDTFKKIIPLARLSSPQEICDAIHYILASPSLTGQILSLGGGMNGL